MSEILRKKFFELTGNIRHELQSVHKLADQLELLNVNSEEKLQCTTTMRDNIDIMLKQIDEISNIYGRIGGYEKREGGLIAADSFTMRETRILITDDNEINNCVMTRMLEQFNIEVDVARNGEEAIRYFKEKEYDLILMDYLMPPGIDGIETVERIRSLGNRGEKQLIVGITAGTVDKFKEGMNQYNVELILYKPVEYEQMAVILLQELPHKIIPNLKTLQI